MRPPETLDRLLERAAAFPDAGLRFVDRHEREQWVSWADVHRAARATGAALTELGIAVGDRVAVVYPTAPGFFRAFFGVLAAGAVPVPLYPPLRLGQREGYHRRTAAMLRAAGVRLVLAEDRIRRLLGPALAAAEPEAGCLALAEVVSSSSEPALPADPERSGRNVPAGAEDGAQPNRFRGRPQGARSAFEHPPGPPRPQAPAGTFRPGPEALALVQFSSGTTVDPKPVALTHRAVVAQARILNGFWPDTAELRHSGVSWLPLYHDMGLIGAVFPALERPGVLTLIAPEVFVARPAIWLRTLARRRATISAAPSSAYAHCVEKIADEDLAGVDLASWRVALTGAEPVAPAVLRRFQERFAAWGFRPEALTPVYGLAEASLAVTFSDLDRAFRTRFFDRGELARGRARHDGGGLELPSVGRPVPGFELRVVDDEDRPLPARRVGRVHARGPSLMAGYLGQSEATAQVLRDGWLDTGDLGFVDDGELYLHGRLKDVVILRGRNYSPHEIEQAVDEVAGTRSACAAAVSYLPERADGEVLLLFVERTRGACADEVATLPAACAEAVLGATGLLVDRVVVLEPGTLPRTSSGKLRRGETLRRHLAGELEAKGENRG